MKKKLAELIESEYLKWIKTDDENYTNYAYIVAEKLMKVIRDERKKAYRKGFEDGEVY